MRLATLAFALLLAPTASGQTLTALTSCCPNTVVTLDPETGETVPVAEVGTDQDLFNALVGSVAVDVPSGRAFMVRNGLVVTVDLATGDVTEGPPADDFIQLAGYDGARDQLLVFASDIRGGGEDPTVIDNYLVGYRPATQDTVRIARIGGAVIPAGDGDPDDSFGTVSGPAVADGDRLFTIRNGRLVSVDLGTGVVTEGEPTDGELLGYDAPAGALYRLAREDTVEDGVQTIVNRIVRQTETASDTLAQVAAATIDADGNMTGDAYLASFGIAVYDAVGDRVVLSRNGAYLFVDLATGDVTEGLPASAGVVGGALSRSAVSTEGRPAVTLGLSAFPNPARGAVTVAVAPGVARVEVLDALGRRVAVLADGAVGGPLVWGTNGVPPGVYQIRALTDGAAESVAVTVLR